MNEIADLQEIGLFVFCWERRQKRKLGGVWQLCHVLGVDMNGHPVAVPGHALPDGVPDRSVGAVWDFWIRRGRKASIKARAVTGWSFIKGVLLMDLNLPYMGDSLLLPDELKPEWFRFVKDGYQLSLGTERTVREVFFNRGSR